MGGIAALVVGLSTLAIPGVGPVVLGGAQAALVGTVAGGF